MLAAARRACSDLGCPAQPQDRGLGDDGPVPQAGESADYAGDADRPLNSAHAAFKAAGKAGITRNAGEEAHPRTDG